MPTLDIQGRKVSVGDEFLKLSPEQQASEVEDIASQLGIKAGALPDQPLEHHDFSELPQNILPSAVNAVTGFVNTVMHPEPLIDAIQGGVDRIMPAALTKALDAIAPRSDQTREQQKETSAQAGQMLVHRYGGIQNIKNTIITDPVGSALDVAGVVAPVLGVAGKGPLAARVAAASPEVALDVSRPAVAKLSQSMRADRVTPQSVADLGPEGMLMDAGPNLRKQGRGVFVQQGEGSQIVENALKQRAEGTTARAMDAADTAMGKRVNAVEERQRLEQARKGNGSPMYQAAFNNAKMVDTAPVLDEINTIIEPTVAGKGPESLSPFGRKLTGYRNRLTMMNSGQVTDARVLQHVYQSIGDDIGEALTKGRKGEASTLIGIKKKLEGAIDAATNNGFSKANAQWATDSEILDAFGFGEDLARNSLTPDEVGARLRGMKPAARAQVLPGLRNWVYEVVGTARNDAAASRALLQRGWTQEKLGMVLGKDKADALAKSIGLERTYQMTKQRVIDGSNTAEGISGAVDVADQPILGQGNKEALINAGVTGLARKKVLDVVDGVLNRLSSHRGDVTRADLAKMLTASGARRDEIARLLNDPNTMKAFAAGGLPAQAIATALKGLFAERALEKVNPANR